MNQERLMQVILAPVVSEKATLLGDKNRQFVFKVLQDATKTEVKKAVELLFKVEVAAVQMCNVKGKKKIFKHRKGCRANWKKAYVTLKEGFDISFAGEK